MSPATDSSRPARWTVEEHRWPTRPGSVGPVQPVARFRSCRTRSALSPASPAPPSLSRPLATEDPRTVREAHTADVHDLWISQLGGNRNEVLARVRNARDHARQATRTRSTPTRWPVPGWALAVPRSWATRVYAAPASTRATREGDRGCLRGGAPSALAAARCAGVRYARHGMV